MQAASDTNSLTQAEAVHRPFFYPLLFASLLFSNQYGCELNRKLWAQKELHDKKLGKPNERDPQYIYHVSLRFQQPIELWWSQVQWYMHPCTTGLKKILQL